VLAAVGAVVAILRQHLPLGIPPDLGPLESRTPLFVGNSVVLGAQAVSVFLFAVAAVAFTRRAERSGDEWARWLGVAMVLGAFARLNYFMFPSLYSEWVYTGDLLRLAWYLVLLVGAAREIQGYWRRLAGVAVIEERRRIARDLHDGLAQELSFISAEASGPLARAAERALDESRRAIAALSQTGDPPLAASLTQAAEEVGRRVGTHVSLIVEGDAEAEPAVREQLIRIVREAVTNAGRHGRARHVRVALNVGRPLSLRIVDAGCGFDASERSTGFGLVSMRERAEALGGALRLSSAPDRGTEIEVLVP